MSTYSLYAADTAQAARFLMARFRKQWLSLPWVFIMVIGSMWILLRTAELVATVQVPLTLPITPGSLLFAAFLLALGKGAVDGYYRMVRNPTLVFALSQPVSRTAVVAAKLETVVAFNLGFVTMCMGIATALILGLQMQIPAAGLFVPALACAVFGGLASGFAFSVAASLPSWKRKGAGLALMAGFPAVVWMGLVQNELPLSRIFALLLALVPASLLAALESGVYLVDAWNVQTSAPSRSAIRVRRSIRLPLMDAPEAAVFNKEIKTAWRRREMLIAIATLALLSAALVSVHFFLSGTPSGRYARYVLPIIAMAGVFLGAALVLTVKGLASIGGEHESVWILRSTPVSGHAIAVGKAASYAILIPAIVAASIPLPLFAGFPWDTTLMVALGSVSISFLMTAIGLRFGTRSPSFDRNTGGLPDSFTMYAVFILGLIGCVIMVGPTAAVFLSNRFLGVCAAILAADFSAFVLFVSVRSAGRRIDRLEV